MKKNTNILIIILLILLPTFHALCQPSKNSITIKRKATIQPDNPNPIDLTGETKLLDLGNRGKITWNAAKKKLTIEKITKEAEIDILISSKDLGNVTVEVVGDCNLVNFQAINLNELAITTKEEIANLTIEKNARLFTVYKLKIFKSDIDINLKDDVFTAYPGYDPDAPGALNELITEIEISASSVRLNALAPMLFNIKSCSLKDCGLISPKGLKIGPINGTGVNSLLYENDEGCQEPVTIEKKIVYPVRLGDHTLNNFAPEIEIDGGRLSYVHADHTISLNNLKTTSGLAVGKLNETEEDDFTINVIGDNAFGQLYTADIKSLTLQGEGKLNVKSSTETAIRLGAATNTFKDLTMSVIGQTGIYGSEYRSLILDYVEASIIGKNGSITNFKEIELKNCKISKPEGAYIGQPEGETYKAVLNADGTLCTDTVKIVRIPKPVPNETKDEDATNETAVESALLSCVTVAPNPIGEVLLIQNAVEVRSYKLINSAGQIILEGKNHGADRISRASNALAPGIYFLRLEAEDGNRTIRVIK